MATEVSQPGHPMDWWHRTVVREADRNTIRTGERIGNIVAIFFIVLLFLILVSVQAGGVGFFTDAFGPLEQVLFYGSLLYGIFPSLVRTFTANKNLGRLADIGGSVLFIVAALWLLYVFPFDLPALVDYLLGPFSSAFVWATNDLARLVLEVGLFISVISVVYNAALYLSVRGELRDRKAAGAGPVQGPGPGIE